MTRLHFNHVITEKKDQKYVKTDENNETLTAAFINPDVEQNSVEEKRIKENREEQSAVELGVDMDRQSCLFMQP